MIKKLVEGKTFLHYSGHHKELGQEATSEKAHVLLNT
jgi:hypothetical protein